MDKKWSIMDRKDIKEKCFQLEAEVQNIFKSSDNWVNGFIRLVSLEGIWHYHRATDIFIPMAQNYLDKSYKADAKPERTPIRLKSGSVLWDYMNEEEALQILPFLPSSNMSKAAGTAGLAERCRNKRLFLADGRVYESESKKVRPLQQNEEGTILQIYRMGDTFQRKSNVSWHYDIYLWAKLGVVPSALYSSKDSWNTMQFLINNFNNIDFEDFLAIQKAGEETKAADTVKKEETVSKPLSFAKRSAPAGITVPPRPTISAKSGSASKSSTPPRPNIFSGKPATSKEVESTGKAAISKEIERSLKSAGSQESSGTGKDTVSFGPEITDNSVLSEKAENVRNSVIPEEGESAPEPVIPEMTEDKEKSEILKDLEIFTEASTIKGEDPGKEIEPERVEKKSTKRDNPEKEPASETEISKEKESVPETELSEKKEPAPETEPSEEKESVPETEPSEEKESVSETEPSEEKESVPETEPSEEKETVSETEITEEKQPVVEIEELKEAEVVAEILKEPATEPVTEEKIQKDAGEEEKKRSVEEAAFTAEKSEKRRDTVKETEFAAEPESTEIPVSEASKVTEYQEVQKQADKLLEAGETVVQKGIIQQEEETVVSEDRIQELLDCDKNRCRLEPYDKDILYDIIRGHWELFKDADTEGAKAEESSKTGKVYGSGQKSASQELIARDPKKDIRQGVIGIDFGTKSTVVVRQDATNRIVPIRIGTGNLSDDVKEEDFENPSIIEFTNVQKFLEEYQAEAGRPHTSCNDIFVSYDAYEDFRNCKPDDFYAYFSELKQWANHEKGTVVIKDKQRREYFLDEKIELEEGTVNPVELYAYYIGLYINNMRNGIYLKYLMTFPVGYAKETRDFIADSFYNGIKKSLPVSILNDRECMEQFKVELGISEPAAYAIAALEQSNLEPASETERLMYGIFDFGGGTTDFDFGICRGATEEEYEKNAYDYVLECFGADSDVTLGGENILELMAYHVYQQNLDVFREKKITFTLPAGENSFAGSETLLINSQIARRNMSILKEELRPLWHQDQGWRKKYQLDSEAQNDVDKEGIIVSLYNMNGEPVPQCILEFSSQELVELIKNRIQKGIDSFFQCLIKIFLFKEKDKKEENNIYIFLAGNSSKSVFVKELFQKKIEEYYSKSKKLSEEMGNAHFELIEPLTGKSDTADVYIPNAKTGVAYGLLKSRPGSSVKIEKNYETDAMQQSRFHYYLGRDHRHHFDCKFSPTEIGYKKWVRFQGAAREIVRIYYTNNPTADSRLEQMSIENVPYKEIKIDMKEDAYLFIRTVEPDMIEYVVAKEVEEISDSDIKKCYF